MKVVRSEDDLLEFDNGLKVVGEGDQDCCAQNFLDFDNIVVGDEFPDMTAKEFINAATLKDDGFIIKASDGLPKWVQARSVQNGYYSSRTKVYVVEGEVGLQLGDVHGDVE